MLDTRSESCSRGTVGCSDFVFVWKVFTMALYSGRGAGYTYHFPLCLCDCPNIFEDHIPLGSKEDSLAVEEITLPYLEVLLPFIIATIPCPDVG